MFESLKMRLMCGFTAFSVAIGSLAMPVTVWADDDDDFLEDLNDLSDEEIAVLANLEDLDNDGDVDEEEVEAVVTLMTIAAVAEAEEEYEKKEAEAARKREEERRAEEERRRNATVSGIWISTTDVTLTPGQTFQVIAGVKPDSASNKGISFSTNNAGVASIDGSGIIRANGTGSCMITARTNEGGYQACTYVKVNPAPVVAAQTVAQDSSWTATAANLILAAAPNATVNLVAPKALSFDAGMISALALRKDVQLLISYPYNGHAYLMAIPAGYNLAARADKNGKVSFLSLAAVKDGKIAVVMTM